MGQRWAIAVALGHLATCTAEIPEGVFACDANRDCPQGWLCEFGRCYAEAYRPGGYGDPWGDDTFDEAGATDSIHATDQHGSSDEDVGGEGDATSDNRTTDAGPCAAVGCNDNNPCTDDLCFGESCTHFKRSGACDDGNPCTYGDICVAGTCLGSALTCQDDPTTCGARRSCNGTSQCSVIFPGTGVLCNDGILCTYSDHCSGAGQCVGSPITCTSDGPPCGAVRSCNGSSACSVTYAGPGTNCNDNIACTYGDACNSAGNCVGQAYTCSAPDLCTTASCDGFGSCNWSIPLQACACPNPDFGHGGTSEFPYYLQDQQSCDSRCSWLCQAVAAGETITAENGGFPCCLISEPCYRCGP